MANNPEAGWLRDPSDSAILRWWDGERWTEHTKPTEALASHTASESAGNSLVRSALRIIAALAIVGLAVLILWMVAYGLSTGL